MQTTGVTEGFEWDPTFRMLMDPGRPTQHKSSATSKRLGSLKDSSEIPLSELTLTLGVVLEADKHIGQVGLSRRLAAGFVVNCQPPHTCGSCMAIFNLPSATGRRVDRCGSSVVEEHALYQVWQLR